jgi:hypothetical protein
VSKDLPKWDAAKYQEEFRKNENGLRQMGIRSPRMLKKHREGRRIYCDVLPKQTGDGKGASGQLFDSYSESDLGRRAEQFAESRYRRDGRFTGLSVADYRQIFLAASPAERAEFCH